MFNLFKKITQIYAYQTTPPPPPSTSSTMITAVEQQPQTNSNIGKKVDPLVGKEGNEGCTSFRFLDRVFWNSEPLVKDDDPRHLIFKRDDPKLEKIIRETYVEPIVGTTESKMNLNKFINGYGKKYVNIKCSENVPVEFNCEKFTMKQGFYFLPLGHLVFCRIEVPDNCTVEIIDVFDHIVQDGDDNLLMDCQLVVKDVFTKWCLFKEGIIGEFDQFKFSFAKWAIVNANSLNEIDCRKIRRVKYENPFYKGYLYSHDIEKIRLVQEFKDMVDYYDKDLVGATMPPCITIKYKVDNHDALTSFLKDNYPAAKLQSKLEETFTEVGEFCQERFNSLKRKYNLLLKTKTIFQMTEWMELSQIGLYYSF